MPAPSDLQPASGAGLAPTPARRPPWLSRALLAFALWAALLVMTLSLEHTAFGQFLFRTRAGTTLYLGLQGLLLLVALASSVMTFVRGPTRDRLIVLIPTVILLWYGLLLISGPG